MTREEFRAKWSARRTEWEKLGVLLSAAKLCEEFVADFDNVMTSQDEAVLNTNEAAVMTGYSRERLLGLYRQGKLRGHKKGKNVFFRAGDLPRKPRGGRAVVASGGSVGPHAEEEVRASARRLADRARGKGITLMKSSVMPIGGCPCRLVPQGQFSLLKNDSQSNTSSMRAIDKGGLRRR